jgi:hypothetical protein
MKLLITSKSLKLKQKTNLGPVCLGCGWLAVEGKLLCRESCYAEKAAVSSFTVWQISWLSGCDSVNR